MQQMASIVFSLPDFNLLLFGHHHLFSVFCHLSSAKVREHFSPTSNAALGQKMMILKPILDFVKLLL